MKKIDYSFKNLDLFNTGFLVGLPVSGLLLLWAHIAFEGFNPWLILPAIITYMLTTFSISGGYHRLFSHRAYKANTFLKVFYLIFGAASGENSALKWSSDHRIHHQHVDTDNDPYNINQGFFYSHIGWVLVKDNASSSTTFPKDLLNDEWVMWQHRNYTVIAIGTNILLALIVGYLTGSYIGSIAFTMLRLTFVHHITFFINSLCHMVGTRPYDENQTARDSNLLAVITFGEGYHNFHHSFQSDYRNGLRWHHWDPTKWAVSVFSWFGWTYDLKRTSEPAITKARMSVMQNKLNGKVPEVHLITLQELTDKVHAAQKRLYELKAEYKKMKIEKEEMLQERLKEMKLKIQEAKKEYAELYRTWRQGLVLVPARIS